MVRAITWPNIRKNSGECERKGQAPGTPTVRMNLGVALAQPRVMVNVVQLGLYVLFSSGNETQDIERSGPLVN